MWAQRRAGEGIERDLQVLEDCTLSLITERRESQPWGLAGGGPGAVGENSLLREGDESRAERLADKCTVELRAGDVVRMLTPGGGGWGVPPPLMEFVIGRCLSAPSRYGLRSGRERSGTPGPATPLGQRDGQELEPSHLVVAAHERRRRAQPDPRNRT